MPKILFLSTEPTSFKFPLSGQPKLMMEQGWKVLLVSSYGREVQQICRAEGVPHDVIPFVKGVNYVEDFISFWPLFQLIRKEKPDVVHSYDSNLRKGSRFLKNGPIPMPQAFGSTRLECFLFLPAILELKPPS